MNRTVSRSSMFILVATSLLLLPASAQETPPAVSPPETGKPVAPAVKSPAESAAPSDEADAPPDLGENVSADNSVSFPVDI